MRYLSLFSGIEAASVAWQPLGWEPVAFCEIDPFPSTVLEYHFPNVPNLGDITKVDWSEYKNGKEKHPDLIVGGSPCFPAGALVLTETGFKNIEEIKAGEKVVSHKGKLQKVLRTGSKIADTIILEDEYETEIETTSNHPFYSIKNANEEPVWTEAGDMLGRRWYRIHSLADVDISKTKTLSEASCYALGKWLGGDDDFAEFVSAYCSMTERNVPSWIFSLPEEYKISLLNGYFEEDNFSIDKKVDFGMRNLYSRDRGFQIDNIGYFEGSIVRIKDGRKNVRVYNLEVENDNSYTVDGIAVHNCQSFSYAGNREGLAGESGLMFEYIRAIREIRPEWFVWENVPGAFTSEDGEAFRQLLYEMDACGYGMAWRVLDSQFFGVPQRRERIFLVGRLGDPTGPAEVLFERESICWGFASGQKQRENLTAKIRKRPFTSYTARLANQSSNGLGIQEECAHTLATSHPEAVAYPREPAICLGDENSNASCDNDLCGAIKAGHSRPIVADTPYEVRKITPLECERLQGFPDEWTKVPYRGKTADECADSPRYKATGNSMAVPVMKWIGERIDKFAHTPKCDGHTSDQAITLTK